jgi:hypothetical protein
MFPLHLKLRIAQRVGPARARHQPSVEIDHDLLRLAVGHLPQAHYERLRSCVKKRPQTQYALAGTNVAEAGVAGGQDDELGAVQIETEHILRGQ